ncbi:MAG: nitroreductase family protein [Spirochaetaceae bacterium]|jgi:nitroreductase|nr:nitroreductase family protein [Spirochaetaceae bacterium]
MSVIFTRRSVRSYLPKPVEDDKIERILRAGFQAPSAHNKQPWEFLLVSDREDLKAIAGMSPWAGMVEKAPLAIACCADTERSKFDDSEGAWWVQDLSAATENILLQIEEEGLGGVWLGWYPDMERVKIFSARFALPSHIVPVSMIALGYPAHPHRPADRYDASRVHYGRWGVSWEESRSGA